MLSSSSYATVPGGLKNYAVKGGLDRWAEGPPTSSLRLLQQTKETLKVKHHSMASMPSPDPSRCITGLEPKKPPGNLQRLKSLLLDPISILLLAWPLGCLAHLNAWGDTPTFWLNFLAMVPLAKILGDATEELSAGLKNDMVGGLLNATFGNAVEMILTVQTLRTGQIGVVKETLLGSVLSNLLLVLGMSFFVGGLTPVGGVRKGKEQRFSAQAALTNVTMLFLACTVFALPTVFFSHKEVSAEYDESLPADLHTFAAGSTPLLLKMSRWCSIYVLVAYGAFLIFQLYTHADVFSGDKDEGHDDEGEEEEEEEAQLSPCVATVLLFVTTCFVAASSEWLVDSIDGLVEEWGMSKAFIGIILLPIVGNACEHAGAVRMAMYEKVDITIGIAVGSSTQIALFVMPFSVIVGWFIDQPMDLDLGALNTTVMMLAVLITFSIVSDGSANWLEGFMLMVAYAVVATLFWFMPDGRDA